MQFIKAIQDYVGSREEKLYKSTLFRSEALLLGLNCLEPGQVQKAHEHADQDKFYYVVEGEGRFVLGDDVRTGVTGEVIWAPAGVVHGVSNESESRLTLLVGIAPSP